MGTLCLPVGNAGCRGSLDIACVQDLSSVGAAGQGMRLGGVDAVGHPCEHSGILYFTHQNGFTSPYTLGLQ